jgi:hypothetical protein
MPWPPWRQRQLDRAATEVPEQADPARAASAAARPDDEAVRRSANHLSHALLGMYDLLPPRDLEDHDCSPDQLLARSVYGHIHLALHLLASAASRAPRDAVGRELYPWEAPQGAKPLSDY